MNHKYHQHDHDKNEEVHLNGSWSFRRLRFSGSVIGGHPESDHMHNHDNTDSDEDEWRWWWLWSLQTGFHIVSKYDVWGKQMIVRPEDVFVPNFNATVLNCNCWLFAGRWNNFETVSYQQVKSEQ